MNRRVVALVLALAFVLTTVVVGVNLMTKAQGHDEDGYGMMETVDDETGMVLRKGYKQTAGSDTKKDSSDDEYSLRLEAYATKDTTTKSFDAKTPLDIVMVLNQTDSMTTKKDVLTGGYAPIENKSSFTVTEAEGKFYKVTDENNVDHYYEVFAERSPNESDYVIIKDDDGNKINSWTATTANNKYKELNQDIYRWNGSEYETVSVDKVTWYKNAGEIDASRFASAGDWDFWTNNGSLTDKYYYNSNGDINTTSPFWHQVYENTRGVSAIGGTGGYYVYLWYYRDGKTSTEDGETVTKERRTGNRNAWSEQYKRLEASGEVVQIQPKPYSDGYTAGGNEYSWDWEHYDAWYFPKNAGIVDLTEKNNYIGGQLYTENEITSDDRTDTTVPYNYMFSRKTDGTDTELAWALTATSKYNLSSSTWTGDPNDPDDKGYFYTAGYKLYYLDDNKVKHEIDCTSVYDKDEVTYNGTLYDWERMSRLEAQKLAADNFANQIAANIGDREYRIAVVGNAGTGTIYSGTKAPNGAFVETAEEVKAAIEDLTSDEETGTLLSSGLTKTTDVFAANPLDPADSRKRIVIAFGDSDTWTSALNSDSNIRVADAKLKDTFNATVYTIGLFAGTPDADTETFISQMSSEYFFTTANASTPIAYTQLGGTYHYIANSDVFPDNPGSLKSTFSTVAARSITTSSTEFVLNNATAVLRDVIHENFNLPTGNTTVEVASGTYDNDGNLSWGTSSTATNVSANWDQDDPRTLNVTGFDYDANYVSPDRTSGSGQKIIVTINGLTVNQRVRTESKSAKRIYFNTTASGIYKKGYSDESGIINEELLINKFPRPFLDDKTMLAPEGGTGTMNDNGIVVNKYLTPTENGYYDLTVEAYTTQTNSSVTEKVPTDFIVVADQSGSMSEKDMPTGYQEVSGTKTLEEIANGKYYVLGDDGNYYRVYGTRNYMWRYYPANYFYVGDLLDRFSARLSWFQGPTEAGQDITNQMYFREAKNGETYYQPITMTIQGKPLTYYIKFRYDSALTNDTEYFDRDNTQYSTNGISPWYKSALGNVYKSGALYRAADAAISVIYDDPYAYTYSQFMGANTGMFVNYPMYDRHVGYNQLLYRDANGAEHVLSATTGQKTYEFCNDSGNALTSQTGTQPTYSGLYEATGYQTRLEALQNALTEFAEAVAAEKNSDGSPVDNKIAIVGFSSPGFNNTELLTNENESVNFDAAWTSPSGSSSSEYSDNGKAHDGIQKATADADTSKTYYKNALVSAYETDANSETKVNQKVTDGIRALTAHGGTQPEDGLNMAYQILENRTVKTYQVKSDGNREVDRHTIVIYFTDGRPGDSTTSNQYKEANDVVAEAKRIKTLKNSDDRETYPSVFSIGVFGESDGNPLTYTAHEVSTENVEYEYNPGWIETYRNKYSNGTEYGNYYYLNRNWRTGNPADYGATASDTIYDYMSVVSSNYPDATQYMKVKDSNTAGEADTSGYDNYLEMLDGVRGTYVGNNDYYRMASNQATLVAAFAQAVTMMNETISADQRLDASSVMQDVFNNTAFNVEDGYSIRATTVDGSMDKYGTVNFKEETTAPATGVITKLEKVGENQTVTVTGFDYLENYINNKTTNSDGTVSDTPHDGKKLVVTISNVIPTITGDEFYSNISTTDGHESSMYTDIGTVKDTDFPTPAISRHKYTLEVREVNPNATFTVSMKVLDDSGNEVAKDANSLADVILVYPNGTRKLYSDVGAQEFLQVGNGESFYLENLPTGYKVQTNVTSTDDAYKYFIWFDDYTTETLMVKGDPEPKTFDYADHTIYIRSERGKKDVSIRERTIGSYGDTTHRFGEVITMEIPVVEGEELKTEFDCTFNEDFSGFGDELPSDATNYKAVFTIDNTASNESKKVAKLTRIDYTNSDGSSGSWSLATDTDPVNYELPMRDGDEIIIKDVPTGNTVKAIEPDTYQHEVFYYYGQDDVSPSGIKLMTTNGDLLEGPHTLTLKNVDGLETDLLEVKFVDGSITEVGGQAVDANTVIDFAKYETMYVINDDLSDAKLNIDGTEVYFDTEMDGNDTAYVATIKRQTVRPPVSVTVEKNDMDILIINERGDIEIEGIFDNHHSKIIYILSGAGVLALAAGGYYVWKKKDEFVE